MPILNCLDTRKIQIFVLFFFTFTAKIINKIQIMERIMKAIFSMFLAKTYSPATGSQTSTSTSAGTELNYDSSIRFLQIADWGGKEISPYYRPSQYHVSQGMAIIAKSIDSQFVLALGDNFYSHGISTDVDDPRFEQTWKSVYSDESLQTPWYLCAGNHDYRGNITAQIAYTAKSDVWEFPSLYYSKSFTSVDGTVSVDVILIDTTTYTGVYTGDVYPTQVADLVQHEWIVEQLKHSDADHVIVAGHFPIYNVCSHASTDTLVLNLLPLLNIYEGRPILQILN